MECKNGPGAELGKVDVAFFCVEIRPSLARLSFVFLGYLSIYFDLIRMNKCDLV